MTGNFFLGIQYFFDGIKQILSPNLRRYILVPIVVNIFLMIFIIIGGAYYIQQHFTSITADYPEWIIIILGGILWLLYAVVSLLVGTLIFTMLTNLIASPFYGLLSEAVEEKMEGQTIRTNTWSQMLVLWGHTFLRECRKIIYFIPWLFLCLIFLIFPLTWPLFPFIWWAIMSWIMAVQYTDYAPDNQQIPFKQMLSLLKTNTLTALGFGAATSIALTIPIFNLIVPAAAVAGGTIFWINLKKSTS